MTQQTMKRFEMAWRVFIWCALLGCLAFFSRESVANTGVGASVGGTAKNPTFTTVKTGDVTIQGAGKRIRGDFSNATHASRVMFQSSGTNQNTIVGVIPNGTATTGQINVYNSSDTGNASALQLYSGPTETRIMSGTGNGGTSLPIQFWTNSLSRLTIATDGSATFTGQVTAQGYFSNDDGFMFGDKETSRIFTGKITAAGAIGAQNPNNATHGATNWIASVSKSTGVYTLVIASGTSINAGASGFPMCTATLSGSAAGFITVDSTVSLNLTVRTFNSAGTATDSDFAIMCAQG